MPLNYLMNSFSSKRRAVITGMGCISAVGVGIESLWNAALTGVSGIRTLTSLDTSTLHAKHAGQVPDWNPRAFFPPHRIKRLDRYAQFAVASALLALEDASFSWSVDHPQNDVGVSFGTALGGISNAESEHASFLSKGPRGISQTLALMIFGGSAHANIAMECGFRGPGTTNSNSCASGAIAVGDALRFIQNGKANVVLAGAAEAPICPLTFTAFDLIKTMSRWNGSPPEFACRPFDRDRDGFVMGEGGACLVIEELEYAKSRGAEIYAEVLGYALNNEAYHMTTPQPGAEMVSLCMNDALADAQITPDQISYINGHASSTQLNDSNETLGIQKVFGANPPPVSGTKAITAHPLGATSAMETIFCALAIQRQTLPPTLHYRTPDPSCPLDYVPNVARPANVRYALNNAFGFGGINACVVLGPAP